MSVVKIVKGDLIRMFLAGHFDMIFHGANCKKTMGAGIAKTIREVFPEAYDADQLDTRPPLSRLGGYSSAKVACGKVVNLYTQFYPGANFEYSALISALEKLERELKRPTRVGVPLIGAGIGGGDWDVIKSILENTGENMQITIVEYER